MNLKSKEGAYELGAGLILVLWGGWLLAQPYLPGTDGYYLLDQAAGILKSGALRIANHDPTPFLAAGLIKIGMPPELSVKLLLFLGGFFWFWLGRRAPSILFFWLTPLFFYHLIQFPKLTFSILLAAQAFLSAGRWGLGLWGAASGLFHPVGLGCLAAARLEKWKKWAPWAAAFVLAWGLALWGYGRRDQSFSWVPVGYKLLTDPSFPFWLRFIVAGWIGNLVFTKEKAWLALGLLAPSSTEELVGSTERWILALILFSAWVVENPKGKLFWAPAAPLLLFLLFQQVPRYDYPLIDEAISRSKDLKAQMMILDHTGKFYFTAKTGLDAYFFEPEDIWPKDHIWRVAQQVTPEELLPYMKGKSRPGQETWFTLGPEALLIREDCWEELRTGISRNENEDLYDRVWDNRINPCRKRPRFLTDRYAL